MSDTLVISSSAELSEPLRREIAAGKTIRLDDVGYTIAPTNAVLFVEDDDEVADMASLRSNRTGCDNTIFVSTRGKAQHGPRIKIAVDPPDSLSPFGKNASMTIPDGRIIGEPVGREVWEQAKQFIDRNREALLDYWNFKIDTDEVLARLKPPLPEALKR